MAEFKSLADLFKSVNKDIDQALDSGVSDYVAQVAISYAKQRVYNRYRIHYERKSRPHYVRRKSLLQEENPGKQIYVFNSKSASVGQSLIAMKIQECEEAGYSFEKVIETVEAYIADQHTFFVLDNLETLRKNGRLSKVKALVASALKIKPVMGSTDEGAICQLDQARGMNKALVKMAQNIVDKTKDSENKILAISHCNCRERAVLLKNALEERMPVKHIVILDTAGVSSMYANDGGVIVAV